MKNPRRNVLERGYKLQDGIILNEFEINAARRECCAIFHYRAESENPYLSFSMPSAYSELLLRGITGWVGRALSPQSGRQHRQHCDNGDLRVLQLTAGEERLARSWARASKYFLVTFNPQSNHNAAFPSTAKHKQTFFLLSVCPLSSKYTPLTALEKMWD